MRVDKMNLIRVFLALSVLLATGATAEPQRRAVPLREALQLAAKQGPDVAAARAQAAITRVGVERAFTAWKPDLTATGTFDHTSAPQEFNPAALGLSGPILTIVAPNSRYGTLQLNQPFLTPEGLFQPGIARSFAEAADRGADESREQVLLSVARTYLTLQGIDAGLGQPADEGAQPWERTYTVRSAIAQVAGADKSVTYDDFLWLPSVAGVAKGSYNSNAGFTGANTYYDLIVNVSIPLYDRGARYAQRHEDQARLQQAMANLASTRARAKANWQGARANLTSSQAVLEQTEAQYRVAKRAQQQIDVSARAGVSTSLDLQVADQNRFQAQSSAAQARANVDIRRAEVAAAEGRLYFDVSK